MSSWGFCSVCGEEIRGRRHQCEGISRKVDTNAQYIAELETERDALRARVAELEGVLQEIIDYADEGEIQDGVKAARAALAKEGE